MVPMTVTRINPGTIPKPKSPYSMVSVAPKGTTVAVVSGQIGYRAGSPDEADRREECRRTFEQVRLACEAVGATPSDIIHLRTLLVGRANRDAFTEARAAVFADWYGAEAPPSSTLAFVVGLADPDAVCEIEALVAIPS